jgi:SnoaL-like domain
MRRTMKGLFKLTVSLAACTTAAVSILTIAPLARAARPDCERSRLQRIEDRQQIEDLFTSYGATLDRRDFAAFGRLFTENAVYVGGGGEPVRGRDAIQAQLEKTLTSNPSHLPEPAFHLYFNPYIQVGCDRATAQSKGAYVIPDPSNHGWRIAFFVSYDDILVRHKGHWLFQQRVIHAPTAVAPAR